MNCPIPHYSTISNIRCYSCMGVVSVFPRPLLPKVFFGRSHKLPKFGVHIHQLVSPDCTVFHSPNGEASHCKWSSWREKRMSWSHGMPGSGTDPRAARVDPFVDENSHINNIIYFCYCLFPFPRRNVPFSGWTKVEVLFSIISSYDIMLHLNFCSWSSHFRWTYNPFLARLDMPGVSRASLEVYCCHWLFANSKEIGAWKDWAGVGADVLRWRNQKPYWGYWGLCLYPGFCFKGWWAELNQLNLHEISKFEIQMRWSVLISQRCPMVALWIVTRKGYEHFHGPFFVSVVSHFLWYQWYPITSWLVWYPHCVTSCFHSVTPKSHGFQDG